MALKVLIINPFGIGDVLFTTPVIRTIKNSWPDSFIAYWCNARVEGFLKNNPNIKKTFGLSRGDLKKAYRRSKYEGIKRFLSLLCQIKKERFDLAIDFSLDHRYSLIAKLLGIRKRIGFNYKNRGRFLTDKIDISGYYSKHVVEYYLDLLRFINIEPQGYNLDLFIPESDRIRARALLNNSGINGNDLLIGIAPGGGASWGEDAILKHWPAEKFSRLIDMIIDKFGAKVILLGDQSEIPIRDAVLSGLRNKVIDLTGKINLNELTAIINNLNILIANDGGPLHIGSALGKKTVSFFGPVDPEVYGPYPSDGSRHIVIRKSLECSPCYANFRLKPCQNNKACLEEISVDEAFKAVEKLCKKYPY